MSVERPGRIAARLARQVEVALGEVDLSLPQYRVLMLLSEHPAVASMLADSLTVTRPSITAVVDGLVTRGLVERTVCADDRRRVEHTLTAEGGRLLEAADERVDTRLAEVAAQIGDDERSNAALHGLCAWRTALDVYGRERFRAERMQAKK